MPQIKPIAFNPVLKGLMWRCKEGKVVCVLSPVPKGQLYTIVGQLRGYYNFTDSDRATTPSYYYTSSSLVKP